MATARVTVDLGNFETRLTFESPEAARSLEGLGRIDRECPCTVSIPSVVHVADPVLLGREVVEGGLGDSDATFSDLKDHVLHPIGGGRLVQGTRVTYKKAASLFLAEVLRRARSALERELEVALLNPAPRRGIVEAWVQSADLHGSRPVTLIDEDTAAGLGYQLDLTCDDVVLVFDFGFSSMRARILQFAWRGRESYAPPSILAAVTSPAGYAARLRGLRGSKGLRCPERPTCLLPDVRRTLELVRDEARLAGLGMESVRSVLLTGRGITGSVQEILRSEFGDRVLGHLPLSAAGRGGLVFLTGGIPESAVKEVCTLQARDPATGDYYYPVVVEEWTHVPTADPVASYVVNTYYDGQKAMDLRLFRARRAQGSKNPTEVVFGPDGRIGFSEIGGAEGHEPALEVPVVIPVDPPGRVGERRFRLEFKVNAQKDLVLSVEDLKRGRKLWDERSLFRLH